MASHGFVCLFAGFLFTTSGIRPENAQKTHAMLAGIMDETATSPCGLGQLDLIVGDATFGDGKLNFVSECRSVAPSSQCHTAAEEIWEGRDLAAKYTSDYDSNFCVKFRDVVTAQISAAFLETASDLDESFFWKTKNKKDDNQDEKDEPGDQKDADQGDDEVASGDQKDASGDQKDTDQGKDADETAAVGAKTVSTAVGAKTVSTKKATKPPPKVVQDLQSQQVWDDGIATSWVPGCYSGDKHEHTLKLGIAVDHHLAEGWKLNKGSDDDKKKHRELLEKEIKETVEAASFTTERQFGIKLEWEVKYLTETEWTGNACPTNDASSTARTKSFQAFKDDQVKKKIWPDTGAWFMLTGCKYYYGYIGWKMCKYAPVFCAEKSFHFEYGKTSGRVCEASTAASIMLFPSLDIPSWILGQNYVKQGVPLVFLQELAITLGADHHLGGENAGVMATAMDTKMGAPTLKEFWAHGGAFQFNTKFRNGEMCNFLERTVKKGCSALTKSTRTVQTKSKTPPVLAKLVDCDGTSTVFRDPSLHAGVAVCCDADGVASYVQHEIVVKTFKGLKVLTTGTKTDKNIWDDHLSWESASAVCQADGKHLCGGEKERDVRKACKNRNAYGVRANFAWLDAKGSWHLAPLGDDECKHGKKITDRYNCKWAAEIALAAHHLESNGQWRSGGWNHLPSGCSVKESTGKIHFNSYQVKDHKGKNPKNNGEHRLVCSGAPAK